MKKKTKAIIMTISLVTVGTVGLIGAHFMNQTDAYINTESKEAYTEVETDTLTTEADAETEKDIRDNNQSNEGGKSDKKHTTEEATKEKDTSDKKQETTEAENGNKKDDKNQTTTKTEKEDKKAESNTTTNTSEATAHQHTWVYVVDQASYDEDIYEDRPVYEEKPVYEEQYVGYHWECYLYGVRTPYMDCIEYADAVVGRNLEGGTLNPEYQAAIGYYCGGCDQVPVDDYETVQVGTEKVQTGTERVKTGTQHHDEVGHYECSCGAIQ